MAKTLTVNTSHTFVSKGKEYTLSDLLDWADENLTSGEDDEPKYSPADLICVGVLRLKALHKDSKRHEAGKLPTHFYVPRVDNLEKVPAPLKALVEEGERVEEKYAPERPAPKARKASKPKAVKPSKPAKVSKPKADPKPAKVKRNALGTPTSPKMDKALATAARAPAVRKLPKAPPAPPADKPPKVEEPAKVEAPTPTAKPASKATEEFTLVGGKLVEVSK